MKTKFFLFVGLLFLCSTFTAQSVSKPQMLKVVTSDVLIGGFTVGGQTLEAWGDSSGNITALYLTDSSGNHTGGQAYSWSGTHNFNHYINVSVQLTSGGGTYTYKGYCWY